jgi:hypothetical protein
MIALYHILSGGCAIQLLIKSNVHFFYDDATLQFRLLRRLCSICMLLVGLNRDHGSYTELKLHFLRQHELYGIRIYMAIATSVCRRGRSRNGAHTVLN